MGKYASCDFKEACFARTEVSVCGFDISKCTILSKTDFGSRSCPFAKPAREITNGKAYPFNPEEYAERFEDGYTRQQKELNCKS